jgi:hypothetical protein
MYSMNTIGNWGKAKIWISLVIIIALGILILVVNKSKDKKEEASDTPKVEETAKTTDTKKTTSTVANGSQPVTLSYSQALTKYANSRIQINESCQLKPASAVYKVGTSVMLDNRSNTSKSILFSGTRYSIAGYGFKVIPLNTVKTFQVDCGTSQNVATITVAK